MDIYAFNGLDDAAKPGNAGIEIGYGPGIAKKDFMR